MLRHSFELPPCVASHCYFRVRAPGGAKAREVEKTKVALFYTYRASPISSSVSVLVSGQSGADI